MWNQVLMIVCGVLCMVGGFWGSSRLRSPYDALVAWCSPAGLLITYIGIITFLIPDFFG